MMQGDSYRVPLHLAMETGEILTAANVEDVEVMLGSVRKTLSEKTVSYDETQEAFLIHLTQQDTFRLSGTIKAIARVKFPGVNDVIGVDLGLIDIKTSISKVVL